MNIYLDHNIYIECIESDDLTNFIINNRNRKNLTIFYSPAHIEEVYRVAKRAQSKHANMMTKLMHIINKITASEEILPSLKGLKMERETPQTVYERVKNIDTTYVVENYSLSRFYIDSEHYKEMLKADKHSSSISNFSEDKIWEYPIIEEIINDFNAKSKDIIRAYNESIDVVGLLRCGIDKRLPPNFCLGKNIYNERLKNSHTQLEFAIEILMRILNFCGYYAEKDELKAISSTHDTTHCIYATATNILISMDKRFSMKTKAIYSFLGVDTQVRYCNNIEAVKNVIIEL